MALEAAWLRADQARRQFELFGSSLELARENLRLRGRAFEEGQTTVLEVSEARNALLRAALGATYKGVPDRGRLTNRVLRGKGTPRELEYIGVALAAIPVIGNQLSVIGEQSPISAEASAPPLQSLISQLDACTEAAREGITSFKEKRPADFSKTK